jgi:YqaJ-like recombinase protein
MLSPKQLAARDGKLTASRVGILMSGDEAAVLNLWQEMLGECEPDDLSAVWPVQLGTVTEGLNLSWYERTTGHTLSRHGDVVICPRADWAACTLDAFDEELRGPVEAKHVGGFEPRERIVARYYPQTTWQMLCTETKSVALSIIEGAREPAIEIGTLDPEYAEELWRRAEAFMNCVWNLTPPCALPSVATPVAPAQWRELEMTGNNAWASFAADWLENKDAAKSHEKASKELKALVAVDVGRAYGHGIQIKRSKVGALSISAMKG